MTAWGTPQEDNREQAPSEVSNPQFQFTCMVRGRRRWRGGAGHCLGAGTVSRLDAGQDVLDGARPIFTEERIVGDRVGITMIGNVADLVDPIIDAKVARPTRLFPW